MNPEIIKVAKAAFLNLRLVEQQQLSLDDVKELVHLHSVREQVFNQMRVLDPSNEDQLQQLRLFADLMESVEYNMQRVWKFEQDSKFHSWWYQLPHCSCPSMDNGDRVGTDSRVINMNCPLHGNR